MSKLPILVAPSILSSDFGHLSDEAKRIEDAGADLIHIDIMDGHFVPNLTLGPKAVAAIRRSTKLFLDVHLMIYNPFDFVEPFVASGANRITFHFEATEDIEDTLQFIKKCSCEAGLAFKPETSMEFIPKYLSLCDLILLMTVQPGFGGQKFIPSVLKKIEYTRQCAQTQSIAIQVDGGINLTTAKQCVEKGANVLVSGSYLFKQKNMAKALREFKSLQ